MWTAEFMAYDTGDNDGDGAPDNAAGPRSAAQAAQQGRDWDLLAPKAMPSPAGGLTYTKAQVDAMFLDRGARTVPLMVVGYVNDGAVALKPETPNLGAPYGPTATYGQQPVHWDPAWFLYDQAYNAGWTAQQRLDHVVRQGVTGVFVLDLDNATLRSEMVEYYARDLFPSDASKLRYDGGLIDVLGPNNVPVLTSTAGGSYTGYTKNSYVTRNRQLVVDANAALSIAVIPNGLVDGDAYADTAANGLGHTSRLLTAANLGMVENFARGPNSAVTAWATNAALEADVDMLVNAEGTLGKGLLCITKLWPSAGYGSTEATMLANSKQWCRYSFGMFLLGAAGRSYFSFRDDTPDKTHRRLDYPTPDNPGTPTHGRRRQFQSQFYGGDRWFDRVALGLPLTTGYTKQARNTANNQVTGLYRRDFQYGQVWVNNTASDQFVTIPGNSSFRYVEFASATELAGGSSQTVPAHSSLILTYVRTVTTPPKPVYLADAATAVTASSAVFHAHTTDTTVTGVTFNLSDGRSLIGPGSSSPFTYAPGTILRASTNYSYTATFRVASGSEVSTNSASFTTSADTTAPTWTDGSPRTTVVLDRIQIDEFMATDYEGIDHYEVTRTGGVGGAVVTNVPPSASPTFTDTSVARNVNYSYSIKAVDAAGNLSSAIVVPVTSAPDPPPPPPGSPDDPNAGPHIGRIYT